MLLSMPDTCQIFTDGKVADKEGSAASPATPATDTTDKGPSAGSAGADHASPAASASGASGGTGNGASATMESPADGRGVMRASEQQGDDERCTNWVYEPVAPSTSKGERSTMEGSCGGEIGMGDTTMTYDVVNLSFTSSDRRVVGVRCLSQHRVVLGQREP